MEQSDRIPPIPAPGSARVGAVRRDCLAMCLVATLGILIPFGAVVTEAVMSPAEVTCFGIAAATCGVFAAIYLPLRWKAILRQSSAFCVLGLLGGFVLVGLGILGILILVYAVDWAGG